ncbi:MAG: alkaline phosphatase family protein, partial [Anaerolineales bacterium]|nr:alkaline phosphatase family protein [Anaerolineales bacterium]
MIQRIWILTLFAILLQSCGLFASVPPPIIAAPITETLTPSNTPALPPTTAIPTETPFPTITPTPLPSVERVLIVSFDGLRPDAIDAAKMVNVMALMQNGAFTLSAQTIMPSLTLPAHASMLVGTCPAKHIVRWNEYVPQNGFALGTDIFDLAQGAGLRTVMVVGKEKLRQVTEPASTDYFEFVDKTDKIEDSTTVLRLALKQINEGFGLMFVHFAESDLEGHANGWMSRAQLGVYGREDKGLGLLIQALQVNGLYESTVIIVTSDHGGHETTHGTDLPEDMTIPWIISGPRIVAGELATQVYIMDTAATAAFALGLPLQPEWDGAPVFEA